MLSALLLFPLLGFLINGLLGRRLPKVAVSIIGCASVFTSFAMHGKDNKIKQTKSEVVDLTKQIHQLELENERLKNNSTVIEPPDKNAL